MPTESELRSWNNDGMDPYWKPDIKDKEFEIIKNIKNIYRLLKKVSDRFDKFSDEELDKLEKDNMALTTNFSIESVREIRKAVKEFEK